MDSDKSYTIPFKDFQDVRRMEKFGSAAVIHKASWKTQHNRQVAIKIYNKLPQDKEVNILRKLDHPNIIKFYGIVNTELSSGIVIEYASGGDLLSYLASKRQEKVGVRLPRRQFTHWCLDIAVALQYLHERHIIHKDIKSPNVLISDDIIHGEDEDPLNRLKLCDFGISKELTNTESVISSCYGGCTRSWAAPEVIKNHRLVSKKSDIYSLCVVFWELWTCQQPWSDHLDHDIETKVKNGIFLEIPTDFPEVMKPMILRCWQMERHRRCGIDDVIGCIKRLMYEWQIKVCQDNKSGNKSIAQSGVISEEIVEEDKSVQQQTRLEDQKLDNVQVHLIQKKQHVEQIFRPIETEWVDATSQNRKSLEISKTDVKEAKYFQSSEIDIQKASDYKEEEEYTEINDDDVGLDHDDSDVYYTTPPTDLQNDYQEIPEYSNIQSEPKETHCPVVDSVSDESMQAKEEVVEIPIKQAGVENSTKQATEHAAVKQTFRPIETEWVDATSQNRTSLEVTKTDVKEATYFQSSEIDIQKASDYKEEEGEYDDVPVGVDHDDSDICCTTVPPDLQNDYYQEIPVHGNILSEPNEIRCPVVDSKGDESMKIKGEGVEIPTKQATEHASELNEDGFLEKGHVAYFVKRFESLDGHDTESLRRKVSGIQNTVNNDKKYERDEHPTTVERSDVAPIRSPVLPVTYQRLISPVPNDFDDCYDDVDGIRVPPKGKSGEELTKLYEHVEKSYNDLKLVKEECIDNNRFHGILNDGELRHLMTNTNDVESIMSRIYTWFNQCRWQIPVICQLITNILKGGYLQPITNFAIHSQLQMNMLKCIRYGHVDFAEKFARKDSEDMNYRLSFKDLNEILLKQANWLKKFHSILKSFCDALVVENVEDTSVIQDLKECCCKLDQIILNCNEHECRIIQDIESHSTSILQMLRFKSLSEKERQSQKAMISEESWAKKIGTMYLVEDIKQSKRQQVIEKKKCKLMAFVSTVIIAEDKGEYLRVIDCVHKNNIKLERQVYQNMNCTGGETLILKKLDPLTKLHIKEYGFTLEDSNEILEWTKALEFSEAEKQSQDTEYITPVNARLSDTTVTEPTYEDYYTTTYGQLKRTIYENVEAIRVLASIITLNKKTIDSLSKLIEWYIDDAVLSSIIREGEKHHLYLNVREVHEVIKSFNRCLVTRKYDSFNLFTELKKRLDNESFYPIIEYQAYLCFQKNMLTFQRKHPTAFSQRLGDLERDPHAKWRVSEMDLVERLSKPDDWLTKLYHKLKSLETAIIEDPDHQEIFRRLNANTLHMLDQLIRRGQDLKTRVAQRSSKHVTSVLLKLPTETINEPHLIRKLSNIQDDWIEKHGRMVLFTKRKKDKPLKKRYRSTQINIYVSTSAIILTSCSDETDRFCYCYDRNYADVGMVDAKSRESWMPERDNLFKLWIYEKEGIEYKQYEYVIGLNSDRSMEDLLKWKSALLVATGESGIFDDYRRPSHIVTESFITDRKGELHLEIDDMVEILQMQDARDESWVKGRRLSDKKTGWLPRNKLGHEVDSEYSRGQEVKLLYQKERERRKESDDEKKKTLQRPKL